jgi:hypothetical protein
VCVCVCVHARVCVYVCERNCGEYRVFFLQTSLWHKPPEIRRKLDRLPQAVLSQTPQPTPQHDITQHNSPKPPPRGGGFVPPSPPSPPPPPPLSNIPVCICSGRSYTSGWRSKKRQAGYLSRRVRSSRRQPGCRLNFLSIFQPPFAPSRSPPFFLILPLTPLDIIFWFPRTVCTQHWVGEHVHAAATMEHNEELGQDHVYPPEEES